MQGRYMHTLLHEMYEAWDTCTLQDCCACEAQFCWDYAPPRGPSGLEARGERPTVALLHWQGRFRMVRDHPSIVSPSASAQLSERGS